MAAPDPLLLFAPGALCAIGTDPLEIAVAVSADCRRFERQRRFPRYRDGDPIVVAGLSLLDDALAPWERMAELGAQAARQSMDASLREWLNEGGQGGGSRPRPVPVLLSMPPTRPGLSDETVAVAAASIIAAVPNACDRHSGYNQCGHDGFMAMLDSARSLLQADAADYCLVGGTDCGLDLDYLHWLERLDRLKGRHQAFGLMPGEGAAFCAATLASRWTPSPGVGTTQVAVAALASAEEPQPWYLGEASSALGLTQAIGSCLAEGRRADVCYCDLNGENWRSAEWDFAYLRNGREFAHPLDLRHPADSWGDVGAASAALMTVLAMTEFADPSCDHRSSLICASSDTRATRSACLLVCDPHNDGRIL